MINGRARHFRRGIRNRISQVVQILDVWIVQLAEVVPNRGFRGNNIGLISAIDDDAVRALRGTQVFAAKVPAGVHQLDGIQRAAPFPRRRSGVRRLAMEKILHRNKSAPLPVARPIRCREFRFHVCAKH